jgi:hypothetical protein
MLERFKRSDDPDVADRRSSPVATAERRDDPRAAEHETAMTDRTDDHPAARAGERSDGEPTARGWETSGGGAATPAALETARERQRTARERQRDEFGGVNWGASFFGWLVAIGIAALLTSILVAAGAAIGLTESDVTNAADEVTLGGGIALILVLMLAYYAGGYVAGRMSRFDGARQGLATWAIGMILTVALALAAVALGDEYNVLEQLNLPALPVGDESLATGGAIALAAFVVGSALVAMAGGKVGERYHRRVDRAGFVR